jgi:hypothetical protein
MVEIDNEQINSCKQEYRGIDPYIIWLYRVNYLLNQQGIHGNEKEGRKLFEQARNDLEFSVIIE